MTNVSRDAILPNITEENAPYWRSAREHSLKLPYCADCSRFFYPVQSRCPRCLGSELDWRKVSGRGRVYSWINVHQVYHPSFESLVPYITAVVELEEGPRLVTNIVNCESGRIKVGLKVRVVYKDLNDECALVQFEPDE